MPYQHLTPKWLATCLPPALLTVMTVCEATEPVPTPHPEKSTVTSGPAPISSATVFLCHRKKPRAYQQWGRSKHFMANIGCYECHKPIQTKDAIRHKDYHFRDRFS